MQTAFSKPSPGVTSPQTTPDQTLSSFWRTARNNVRLLHQSPRIQLAPQDQPLPLSFNQERLWKLEQLQPDSSVHNLLHSFRLVGALDFNALEQSLLEIARRHDVLRTTFAAVDGQPTQQITDTIDVQLSIVDLRYLSAKDQKTEVQNQAIAQADHPFDLSQGPLWRVMLLQLADEEYVLLRTIHHIVFDGMSHSVFVRELGALYAAFVKGEPSPLLDPPVQYADFAWTQRQWLQGENLALQMDYWQQHFSGNVPALELPTDSPRSAATSYQGGYESRVLSSELVEALKSLSVQQGVSLFVTLFAGFNTVLHQYTGQEDMIICSPVSGRHRAETRGLIGYFNNVIVLRSDLSANPSFSELLGRVSQRFMETLNYQDTPLQLVAELPNLVRTPLTRAMFVLQNTATPSLELEGVHVSSVFVDREIANFDLSLSVHEKSGPAADPFTVVLQYKADLFHSDTIAQILEQYICLLESLVINPEQRLSELPVLRRANTLLDSPEFTAEAASDANYPYVAPRSSLEQKLTQIWEEAFRIQPIGITNNFFGLGGHSLLAVQILTSIENQLGRRLPITTLLQFPTIEALSQLIETPGEAQILDDWVPLKQGGNRPPLFCIYGILLYQDLANHLDVDQPIYGVYLQEEVELLQTGQVEQFGSTFSSVQTIATRYLKAIQKLQPHGPYYLCGESFGGLVAYEMAQQLQAIGESVAIVAMFDSLSPSGYSQNQLKFSARLEIHRKLLLKQGLAYFHEKAKPYKRKIKQKILDSAVNFYQQFHPALSKVPLEVQFKQQLAKVHQWLSSSEGIQQAALNTAEGDIRDQVRRQMTQTYTLKPYSGKTLLFRALERDAFEHLSYDLGWGEVAGQNFHIFDIPGDHLGILKEPNVQILADKLQKHINESQRKDFEIA